MPEKKILVTIKEEEEQVDYKSRSSKWNCLRSVGKFVAQLARYILLVASCIYLFSSLILLLFSQQTRTDLSYAQLDHVDLSLTFLIGFCAYLMLVAVYGIYATFFSNRNAVKGFAALTTINIVFGLFIIIYVTPRIDTLHKELVDKFAKYQPKFDWNNKEDDSIEVKNATWAWNSIQTKLHCCGLHNPADWAPFRPPELSTTDALPRSCCRDEYDFDQELVRSQSGVALTTPKPEIDYAYCMPNTMRTWSHDCASTLKMLVHYIMDMVLFTVIFSIKIGILAGFILLCGPKPSTRSRRTASRA